MSQKLDVRGSAGNSRWKRASEEHVKKRMLSIMICTNWVCTDLFVNHEWVLEKHVYNMSKKYWV